MAAARVRIPVISQDASSQPGLPTLRDMSADTIKMPEPIMEPVTIMVESNRPRERLSPGAAGSGVGVDKVAEPWHEYS